MLPERNYILSVIIYYYLGVGLYYYRDTRHQLMPPSVLHIHELDTGGVICGGDFEIVHAGGHRQRML